MAFPIYESYKDSEVPDLGEIPAHWKVVRNRFLFQEQNERSLNGQETHLCMSQKFGLVPSNEFEDKTLQSESYEGARLCKKGDLVLNRLKAHLSVFSTAPCDGLVSPDYSVFRLHDSGMIPKYFEHLFKSPVYLSEFNRRVRGIVAGFYRLYTDDFNDVRAICPPIEEQKRIIEFLDRKTSEIDQAIAQKQRLIELLQEQKAILINQAVTKGLNPKASMRDTGIIWLGQVPEHWEIKKLKWFAKTESGATPDSGKWKEYYENGDVSWVRTLDLNDSEVWETEIKITQRAVRENACRTLPVDTVMIAMYGGDGTIGKNGILKIPASTNQAVCAILPNQVVLPNFLHKYIQFYRPHWMFDAVGARKDPNISQKIIRELIIPVPPVDEQAEIIAFIQYELQKTDDVIKQAEKEIEIFREYIAVLISNVVTGKIKV